MSSFQRPRRGGLILAPKRDDRQLTLSAASLYDGPDVSWLSRCRVGDDQGKYGACAIFTMANWAEIVIGISISDQDCIETYQATVAALGRTEEDGLTYQEAFAAAHAAGWLPGVNRIVDADADLSDIKDQPLLGAYAVTDALYNVNAAGCLDHSVKGRVYGYHAMCIPAVGRIEAIGESRFVWIENSWGIGYGWRGLGVMLESLHQDLVQEVWRLE